MVSWIKKINGEEIKDCTKIYESSFIGSRPIISWLYPNSVHDENVRDPATFKQQLQCAIEQSSANNYCNVLYIKINLLRSKICEYINISEEAGKLVNMLAINPLSLVGIPVDHYVLLKDIKYKDNSTDLLDITIYTWGLKINFTLSVHELEKAWSGLVSYKMPTVLLEHSGKDLINMELDAQTISKLKI